MKDIVKNTILFKETTGKVDDHPAGPSGFTLLEILVSMALVALVVVSVFKLQGGTIAMARRCVFYSLAGHLAASAIAGTSGSDFDEASASGDFGDALRGASWQRSIHQWEGLEGAENAGAGDTVTDARFLRMDLVIEYDGSEAFSLSTWRYDATTP